MTVVQLVHHDLDFSDEIYRLSSAPPVKDALGLPDGTVENTRQFVHGIMKEEDEGKTVSRVILNEKHQVIGITTLMFIDPDKRSCHIGSWIGHEFWSMGYNEASKLAILRIAFEELDLSVVFAGARQANIRSQKAQEKLPFIRLHVEDQFPEELQALEKKEQQPCVLHAFFREDFIRHIEKIK